jgi:hypothetical protein
MSNGAVGHCLADVSGVTAHTWYYCAEVPAFLCKNCTIVQMLHLMVRVRPQDVPGLYHPGHVLELQGALLACIQCYI